MKAEKEKLVLGASVLSAIAASLCCIGPLVALLLGVGGFAAASVWAKWRPLFLLVTFGLLGWAWYFTYRKPKAACAEGATCEAKSVPPWKKVLLWLATAMVVGTSAFPIYSGAVARWVQPAQPVATSQAASHLATLRVNIPSMDCRACAANIQRMIEKQNGVRSAQVSFDTKDAVVQYDPQKTSPQRIIEAINRTGFPAQP